MNCNNCENVYPGKIVKCDKEGKCENCGRQIMTQTTPSKEDWEKDMGSLYAQIVQCYLDTTRKGYQKKKDGGKELLKFYIRHIIKDHNNALVAEIENLERYTHRGMWWVQSEKVIRIIQEK